MLLKCYTHYVSKFIMSAVATGLEKISFHFYPIERQAKECSKSCTTAFSSHASKRLTGVQARFRKGRGIRDQIANICWIIGKAREFQRNIYFCFIDYANAFECEDHEKLENISRDGNARPLYLPPEEAVCRKRSNS